MRTDFYKMIELKISSTGKAYFDAIREDLEKEDLWNYVVAKIVAITTDAAANMVASNKGFVNIFKRTINKPKMIGNKCMAHRLETILKHAYKDCTNCEIVADCLKKIHSFYSKSPKRLDHYKKFCKDRGVTCYRPTKILPVRWVASHHLAAKIVYILFDTIIAHLEYILGSPLFSMDRTTKSIARKILKIMKRSEFLSSLALQLDVQGAFKGLSELLQQKGKSILGVPSYRQKLLGQMEKIRIDQGTYMADMLRVAKCGAPIPLPVSTTESPSLEVTTESASLTTRRKRGRPSRNKRSISKARTNAKPGRSGRPGRPGRPTLRPRRPGRTVRPGRHTTTTPNTSTRRARRTRTTRTTQTPFTISSTPSTIELQSCGTLDDFESKTVKVKNIDMEVGQEADELPVLYRNMEEEEEDEIGQETQNTRVFKKHLEKVSSFKDAYIDSITDKLDSFLPVDELAEVMQSLDQFHWPLRVRHVLNNDEITRHWQNWPGLLAIPELKDYNNTIHEDMTQVIDFLALNPDFWCAHHKSPTTDFYMQLLIHFKSMPDKLATLIKATASIVSSGADVERSYSVLFGQKTYARSSMSPEMVDATVRIQMHKDTYETFNVNKVSEHYTENHEPCDRRVRQPIRERTGSRRRTTTTTTTTTEEPMVCESLRNEIDAIKNVESLPMTSPSGQAVPKVRRTDCFLVINKESGKVMTNYGDEVVLMTWTNEDNQLWFWYDESIVSFDNGKVLETNVVKEKEVYLNFYNPSQERQKWTTSHQLTTLDHEFISKHNKMKLDVIDRLQFDGSTVGASKKKNLVTQKWKIEELVDYENES